MMHELLVRNLQEKVQMKGKPFYLYIQECTGTQDLILGFETLLVQTEDRNVSLHGISS